MWVLVVCAHKIAATVSACICAVYWQDGYKQIYCSTVHIPVVCKLIVEQQHNPLHSYVMDGQQCILVVTSLKFKVQDQLPCQNVIHSLRVQPHLILQSGVLSLYTLIVTTGPKHVYNAAMA